MSDTLPGFLRKRAERSYNHFANLISGVSAADAVRFRSAHWPDHPWGIGQDGSVCGIVYHTAAWKQMTLPMFSIGGEPLSREQFDLESAPDPANWDEVRNWYVQIGATWNQALMSLTDIDFDSERNWEGHMLPVSSFVVEMMEHDVQHSSQVEYLLQRISEDLSAGGSV